MKKSLICIIAFLFLFCISAWAESMDKYYEVETSYPDYDTTQTSGFIYSDSMLLGGSTPMSGDLCKASAVISAAVYDSDRIQSVMEDMDYSVKRMTGYGTHTIDDCDHVAYTVGKKEIEGGKVLYCIAIRGTGKNSEWFSDFNLGDPGTNGGEHLGFKLAADEVFWDLNKLFNDDGCNSSNRYLWFMGHSRGAAVANILAARYANNHSYAIADHIFGYTFACPAVTKNPESYSNIFNFNNKGDVIPTFPLKDWDYGRHGQDYDYAFTGDVEFEASFYREVKRENSATFDTYAYEQIVKNLVPEEEDITDPVRHFGLMVLAWCLGGKTEVSLDEVLAKYADDVFTEEYLKAQVLKVTGLDGLYSLLSGGESDTTEEIAFIEKAIVETREMDSEEFHQWTLDNYDMIVKIAKTTGQTISTYADLDPVLGTITRLAPTFWDVGECIGCIMDIVHSSNGNALYSIIDGHRQGTYVRGWNARYLGYKAYEGMDITTITIPENVFTIGSYAFQGSNIVDLNGMEHVKAVGGWACEGCLNIIHIPTLDNVMYLGAGAFYQCSNIVGKLVVPAKLGELSDRCFDGCHSITEIIIPKEIRALGERCFGDCSSIREVTIPIELSGNKGFEGCGGVNTVHYTFGSTGIMPDREQPVSNRFFSEGYLERNSIMSLKNIDFEEGILHIGAYSYYCTIYTSSLSGHFGALENIIFPSTLESIGACAFYEQSNLSEIILPDGIKELGESCFTNCTGANKLFVPDSIEKINSSFGNCRFNEMRIPVTFSNTIGMDLERNLYAQTVIYTPGQSGVMQDGKAALGINIVFEEGVKSIGNSAFYDFWQLETITLPDSLESIGSNAFCQCLNLASFSIPSNICSIGASAFYGCTCLTEEIVFSQRLKVIGENAFASCSNLSAIDLSSTNLTEISPYAFSWCSAISGNLILPESVMEIGDHAFEYCSNLNGYLVIPPKVKRIGDFSFDHCSRLSGELVFPDCLEYIGSGAFMECSGFRGSLLLPDNVSYIGDSAFNTCSGFDGQLKLSKSLDEIGWMVFDGCINICGEVIIPENVSKVVYCAFRNCKNLTRFIFGQNVQEIGAYAFFDCVGLQDIIFLGGVPSVADRCFGNTRITVYYPCLDETWDSGFGSVFTGGTLSWIKFAPPNLIYEMIIPNSLYEIGVEAFEGCSFESVYIPNGCTRIDSLAFANNESLVQVFIPQTVTSIAPDAFLSCDNVTIVCSIDSYARSFAMDFMIDSAILYSDISD